MRFIAHFTETRERWRFRRRRAIRPRGWTLLELLIVVAIIAILIALLLPSVQHARESSRRATCGNSLRQLILAVHSYEAAHRCFPPSPAWNGYGVQAAVLDHLNMNAVERIVDPGVAADFAALNVRGLRVPLFLCPSDGSAWVDSKSAPTNYAGNFGTGVQKYGYNGLFSPLESPFEEFPAAPVAAGEVSDGLSNTAALSELLVGDKSPHRLRTNWQTHMPLLAPNELEDFAEACKNGEYVPNYPQGDYFFRGRPWLSGNAGQTLYNHVLTPNQPSCTNGGNVQFGAYTVASNHPGGVNVAFGDGRVEFTSQEIDIAAWRALGSRAESE